MASKMNNPLRRWISFAGRMKHQYVKSREIQKHRKMLSSDTTHPNKQPTKPFGVNLGGLFTYQAGVGESVRIIGRAIETILPGQHAFIDYPITKSPAKNPEFLEKLSTDHPFAINIIHLNPPALDHLIQLQGAQFLKNRYNIFIIFWELEKPPKDWHFWLRFADEIWVTSEFVQKSLSSATDKPVHKITPSITVQRGETKQRSDFDLPEDQTLFLLMYDVKSISARKNPEAVIEAYRRMTHNHDCRYAGLVIKVNHATDEEMEALRSKTNDLPNIHIRTGTLSRDDILSLIDCCDSLISLHRSEGFGLILTEAMLLEKPVIGTNWSSTAEFLHPDYSYPVDVNLIEIIENQSVYERGNRWADPDIDQAAAFMHEIVTNPERAKAKGQKAKAFVQKTYSDEAMNRSIREHITRLRVFF